ncbi:hypothetical protein [Fortiea contorta]|uniref:hypothetical protein n=1 Tax=Fortiea contorta TaxID=1892405 RepID=UPI00034CA6CD|nr:hypothetical protein [Fortiea contorta]
MKINEFGQQKEPSVTAKRQLLKALQRRNASAIQTLIVHWQKILGTEQLVNLIVREVMIECDSQSHSWFIQTFLEKGRYVELEQQAQNHVWQMLVNAGLELGKDFSFGQNHEMMVSDRTQEILLHHLPENRQTFFTAQIETSIVPDPIIVIEQHLGCPFFTTLTEIASQKMRVLQNAQAAAYLGVMIAGLVQRYPELQDADFPTKFIFSALAGLPEARAMAILNDEQTAPTFNELIIFQDLLLALNDPEAHRVTAEDGGISLNQLKKLDLVWCGQQRIAEIIAVVERRYPH